MADSANVTKAILKTTEGTTIEVEFPWNPTQFVQDKTVAWAKHKNTEGDDPMVEFNAGEPTMMTVEFLIDGYEQDLDVREEYVAKIQKMAHIDDGLKRPPMVLFTWGSTDVFKGVITKVGATFNMFTPEGIPTRAKVNLTLQKTTGAMSKEEAKEANKASPAGTTATEGNNRTDQTENPRATADSAGGNVDSTGRVQPGTPMRTA
jgi:hypothetical protein